MTGTQLATDIRRRTNTSSTTLPDATLLPIVNFVKDEICTRITQKEETLFVIPSLQNLVASDINAREYALPDDVLNNLVTVEIDPVGTASPLAYKICQEIPLGQAIKITGGLTEGNITNSFNNTTPYFFRTRRSIFILSAAIAAVTNGLKIRYRSYPTDLANVTGVTGLEVDPSTTTFGVPRQFHYLWAMKVAIEWKQNRAKPIPLSQDEQTWNDDMTFRLDEIKKGNLTSEETGQFPSTSREGNYGYNI
jgi:hypothetical protein